MRELAFILFCFPIDFIRTDGFELVEFRVEDSEIEVMAQVNPGGDEKGKVGSYKGVIYVIEGFGCLDDVSELMFLGEKETWTYS